MVGVVKGLYVSLDLKNGKDDYQLQGCVWQRFARIERESREDAVRGVAIVYGSRHITVLGS
jgi:hypothetical protein